MQSRVASWRSMQNNAQGHFCEGYIKGPCARYREQGLAVVEQIPEPFRTMKTNRDGTFTGRFLSAAQPDFMGTLRGGRTICFEAKYTRTDRILQSVLTQEQWDSLEAHWTMGAVAGVCVGIGNTFAMVPWSVWRDMKQLYGRKYMNKQDLEPFRVKFNGFVMFLNYLQPENEHYLYSQINPAE